MVIKDRDRVDDHYSALARKEGYPARSVYKLKEMDEKRGLLGPGQRVLDLGCHPGSWSIYASRKVKIVVGVDLQKMDLKMPKNFSFFLQDILEDPPSEIVEFAPFQVILSDLAPRTSGDRFGDSLKSLELARAALSWAKSLLAEGGSFVCKFFQGKDQDLFLKEELSPLFQKVVLHKPKAVRKKSVELYALGLSFRGASS
ncbi:MAG: RlmE family RNA methyltransferase [Deltaproteobacteria bacterium]|nr:RlmE family RNA methyltransferase [Deltaproteobacteria bacterium]